MSDLKNKTFLIAYIKGLLKMLDSMNNGRFVHERGNLKQSLANCLSLIEKGQDISEWCSKNLPELSVRVKKLHRDWASNGR